MEIIYVADLVQTAAKAFGSRAALRVQLANRGMRVSERTIWNWQRNPGSTRFRHVRALCDITETDIAAVRLRDTAE